MQSAVTPIILMLGVVPQTQLAQHWGQPARWLTYTELAKNPRISATEIAAVLLGNNLVPAQFAALAARIKLADTVVLGTSDALLHGLGDYTDSRTPAHSDVAPFQTSTVLRVAADWPAEQITALLNLALQLWSNHRHGDRLQQALNLSREETRELSKIAIALSAEKDLKTLLSRVLSEGRKLARCEGASLFLIDHLDNDEPQLRFMLTQNQAVTFDFEEKSFALSKQSLAGFVALTGEVLNLRDVYHLPAGAPYQFDRSFDQKTGYTTRDMLVLPMRNHSNKLIGVLQFLNRSNSASGGFDSELCERLLALASQAAVSIDNSLLLESIHNLFEGFVSASVKAIEARDPITSGHSFRVAEFTLGLARALPRSESTRYRDIIFSTRELRELRYAALLHDFGKVGVTERVLLKAQKLEPARFELLELRLEWMKEHYRRQFFELKSRPGRQANQQALQQLEQQIAEFETYSKILGSANQPTVLHQDTHAGLDAIRVLETPAAPWGNQLLSQNDFLCLSVTRGNLTTDERNEIKSHVTHTIEYLEQIPWTDDLAGIPGIAGAHHEKLNGAGYPKGLEADAIPLQSQIMTVADIYDALTARDRPYKNSIPATRALDILKDEAKSGALDGDLVQIFIDAGIYHTAKSSLR